MLGDPPNEAPGSSRLERTTKVPATAAQRRGCLSRVGARACTYVCVKCILTQAVTAFDFSRQTLADFDEAGGWLRRRLERHKPVGDYVFSFNDVRLSMALQSRSVGRMD